jgi:hypothetical protein
LPPPFNVRRVQPLSLEAVGDDRDAAVVFGPGHLPRPVPAGDQAPLAVAATDFRVT